jgi:cephalosporin hydroxylase
MTQRNSYDIRTDRAFLPREPKMIPLPQLYAKMKDRSHHWSTCYPAWNLQYYCCLGSLKHDRPNVLVETGTNHGCSAALLAQTLVETKLEGHLHTFELDQVRANRAKKLFVELGLQDRITVYVGDCHELVPQVITPETPVDFAFIDANHATAACVAEAEMLVSNVKLGEVDAALCQLKEKYGTSGWVDFPNVSRVPNGQAIWQPWQRTQPIDWHDSKKERASE